MSELSALAGSEGYGGCEDVDVGEDSLEKRIVEAARALTDQQKMFVHEYMIDFNGTQAAIRAGYAEKTAAGRASRLLRTPKIRAYRDLLMEERFEAVGINKHNIVLCTWQLYLRCTQKVPVMEWSTTQHEWVPSGEWQFDARGAMKALEMLARMLPEMKKDGGGGPTGFEAMLAGETAEREF